MCGQSLLKENTTKKSLKSLTSLAKGEIKRLIINMPPRHTKSEFASFLLPSWMVDVNQILKIIQTTHTTELAIRFGRKAKTLIDPLNINKCLRQDSEKIRKPRVNGKPSKVVNTMQRVWIGNHGPWSGFINYR